MKILYVLLFLLISCSTGKYTYTHNPKSDKFKLCFIGDTGTAKPVQYSVASMLKEEQCHSIHFLGDIIYPHGLKNDKDEEFLTKFWNIYGPITKSGHKPRIYIVLGNHDHDGSAWAWKQISDKYPEIIFPYPWYFVRMNNVCLVHLDTDYYRWFTNYFMTFKQLRWTHSMSNELKNCGTRIALAHHPYKSKGPDHGPSTGLMKYVQEDTIIGKFDYYITGHEHVLSDEGEVEGTRLLISGAGGQPEHNYNGGYLVMEIEKNKTNYYFRSLPK